MTDEKEWLVSDKTCKGCVHYGMFDWSGKIKYCAYTSNTGKIRTDKPKDCTVKQLGKHVYFDELRKHRQRPQKGTV